MKRPQLSAVMVSIASIGFGGLATVSPAAQAAAPQTAAPEAAYPYDFNGDKRRDIVLGSPYGTAGGKKNAGFFTVSYRIDGVWRQTFSQKHVPGSPETGDMFGYGIASEDLNKDGYADLLVGAPGEDTPDGEDAGMTWVMWGSAGGLSQYGTHRIAEPDAGKGHRFGTALTAGKYNGKTGDTKAIIAAPGAGRFHTVSASTDKRATPKVAKHRLKAGKANQNASPVEAIYLATGDVNDDEYDDLVLGVRDEDAAANKYSVGILRGAAVDELKDDHGSAALDSLHSVSAGDVDEDGAADVAAGNPGDDKAKGGHVTVFRGGTEPISIQRSTSISQDSPGVPGKGEAGDKFGYSVSLEDIGEGDEIQMANLVIGSPGEDLAGKRDAGRIVVDRTSITQDTKGVPGKAESGDKFGWEVTVDNRRWGGIGGYVLAGAPSENAGEGAYWSFPWWVFAEPPMKDVTVQGAADLGVAGRNAQIGIRTARA